MWLSASGDLLHDARRDLADIGAMRYHGVALLDLKAVKAWLRKLDQLPGGCGFVGCPGVLQERAVGLRIAGRHDHQG